MCCFEPLVVFKILKKVDPFCSYLALVTAMVTEASWAFIPESPAEPDWQEKLCNKCHQVECDVSTRFSYPFSFCSIPLVPRNVKWANV
jgi:hypothetical protein